MATRRCCTSVPNRRDSRRPRTRSLPNNTRRAASAFGRCSKPKSNIWPRRSRKPARSAIVSPTQPRSFKRSAAAGGTPRPKRNNRSRRASRGSRGLPVHHATRIADTIRRQSQSSTPMAVVVFPAGVIIRKQNRIVEQFRTAGATSASKAKTVDEIGADEGMAYSILLRHEVLHKIGNLVYLDETSWESHRKQRRRNALIAVTCVVVALALMGFITYLL